ncbi:uncharacterized protein (DUF885 family) [Hymenobacter luteus]|uniref:Uncharacterized protein (DUF885 family) n=2 Tax=Hymenobacter TaxID=89966 RepID=A0A7W9SWJ2_9BACT|nr:MULTISPECIES: DUF885 domain-containing protein [Hymenobacter]MBB4600500.1 uncharacterized protein (DUF885 family) [Hymenobacter latericoloratus]MBB6057190.1 uncharacterized protein (DUF885 family) [Hymenobacter luteus]
MKKLALGGLFACALLAAACNQQKSADQSGAAGTETNLADIKDTKQLFDAYWEENARLFPLEATAQGDNRYNDQLPNDGTQEFRGKLRAFYQKYLDGLQKFNREELSANDKISYDMFRYDLESKLEGIKLNTWMIPYQQFWGLPLTMGQYGSGEGVQPFKTAKDYDNWLGRVRGFSVWADTAISNFRQGMKAGVVLPKALVEKMIPQMRAMETPDPTKSLFYGPINKLPEGLTDAEKQRITAAYKKAIQEELVPTYKKLGDFLEKEYLPKSRPSTGIAAIPGGPEIYKYYVKTWTTTDKTPEEIYQTGQQEVARIRGEMEKVKAQVGFKGDLKAFFASLKTDPKLMPYKTPEEVLGAFRAIQTKMEPNLKKMFGRTPKTPFEIRQTEAFRAASASAEYNPGSPDGSRPGIFYIPIVDATKFNVTSGMESLFLHEAIPGHHYQTSLQQENTDLPKFRRFAWYGAMGEGWALYTESLGKELGLYQDPYQYMGALGDEMHRAVRLVVDVGMHTKNMTREEAIKYMLDNEAISEDGAVAEIERYMAIPGQALSYKIGALKIRELRQKYEKQLGAHNDKLREKYAGQSRSHFRLSDFHDELLKDGVMPLAVLERKMDAWAANQK